MSDLAVTPAVFGAYSKRIKSYVYESAEQDRWFGKLGMIVGACGSIVGVAGILTSAVVISRHQEHWGFLGWDSRTGAIHVISRPSEVDVPQSACLFFVKHYVEMREGYSESTDKTHYNTVVGMSAPSEQSRYSAWFNSAAAPRYKFSKAGHGWREADTITDPYVDGIGKDGAQHMVVRYRIQDYEGMERAQGQPMIGTVRMTVRQVKEMKSDSNWCGISIDEYSHQIDRTPQ
jgi:type IV secretory pathway component VirB8